MIRRFALASALWIALCSFAPAARDSNAAEPPATTRPTTVPAEPRILARLHGHGGLFVGFSPDGSRILTVGKMDLHLWDARTYQPGGSAVEYPGEFVSAGFAAGGHVAYLAHSEGVWLFDAQTGARIGPGIEVPGPLWAVAVSPDGRTAALSWVVWPETDPEPVIHLFDTATGREVGRLPHPGPAMFATFSPDGRRLLSMDSHEARVGQFHLWDVATRREVFAPIETACESPIRPMGRLWSPGVFSPDGGRFALFAGNWFAVFDSATGRRVAGEVPGDASGGMAALAFSADGKRVLAVQWHDATLCDAATAKQRTDFAYLPMPVSPFSMSADGARLVCSYKTGTGNNASTAMGIFDPLTGKLLHRLGGDHEEGIPTFSPSGERVAVTGTGTSKEDTTVWSVARMKR